MMSCTTLHANTSTPSTNRFPRSHGKDRPTHCISETRCALPIKFALPPSCASINRPPPRRQKIHVTKFCDSCYIIMPLLTAFAQRTISQCTHIRHRAPPQVAAAPPTTRPTIDPTPRYIRTIISAYYFLSSPKQTTLCVGRERQTTFPCHDERRGAAIHTEQIQRIRYRFIHYSILCIPYHSTYLD